MQSKTPLFKYKILPINRSVEHIREEGASNTYAEICCPAAGALMPVYGIALNPSLSGAAMAVSSIAVLMNSLLLRTAQSGLAQPYSRQEQSTSNAAPQLKSSTQH